MGANSIHGLVRGAVVEEEADSGVSPIFFFFAQSVSPIWKGEDERSRSTHQQLQQEPLTWAHNSGPLGPCSVRPVHLGSNHTIQKQKS